MKKTTFSWFVMLYFIFGIWSSLRTLQMMSLFSNPFQDISKFIFSPIVILLVVEVIVSLVYLYKLFRFNRDIILWTNIAFGYSGLRYLFMVALALLGKSNNLVSDTFALLILYIVWRFFSQHLKKIFSTNAAPMAA